MDNSGCESMNFISLSNGMLSPSPDTVSKVCQLQQCDYFERMFIWVPSKNKFEETLPFKTVTNELHTSLPQLQAQIERQYGFCIRNLFWTETNKQKVTLPVGKRRPRKGKGRLSLLLMGTRALRCYWEWHIHFVPSGACFSTSDHFMTV